MMEITSSAGTTEMERLSRRLVDHPVYNALVTEKAIRAFMEIHVFAVWDFMSLVKSLQAFVAPCSVPWVPSPYPSECVRFINTIVHDEESDVDANGVPMSHFELYLRGMDELGADTSRVRQFVKTLDMSVVPSAARNFVAHTLRVAKEGTLPEVAGAFLYGREQLVPRMFTQLVGTLTSAGHECPTFRYYLERHIALDGDDHGPMAAKFLQAICARSPEAAQQAFEAARNAVEMRYALWDNTLAQLRALSNGSRHVVATDGLAI